MIDQNEVKVIETFRYGNSIYSAKDKKLILNVSIKYLLETKSLREEFST